MKTLSSYPEDNIFRALEFANPWWRDGSVGPELPSKIVRSEFDPIFSRISAPRIRRAQILLGLRQIGKSTLLKQMVDALLRRPTNPIHPLRIVYIDLEDFSRRFPEPSSEVTLTQIVDVHRRILESSGIEKKRCFYFFDEIHACRDWALHMKKLVDEEKNVLVATDSSAILLREKSSESGTGRLDHWNLQPWSYPDFLRLHSAVTPKSAGDKPALDHYLFFGGFPEHAGATLSREVWKRLREDIEDRTLIRDYAQARGVRREPELRALFVGLTADSGAIFDATARGSDLGISRQRISLWVEDLIEMGLLQTLKRLTKSARKLQRAHPKIYSADPGLVTAFSLSPTPERDIRTRSQSFECAVLCHLRRYAEEIGGLLGFDRREQSNEIDFVLERSETRLGIEVTSSVPDRKKLKDIAAAAEAFGLSSSILVSNGGMERSHTIAGHKILDIPLKAFLTDSAAVLKNVG